MQVPITISLKNKYAKNMAVFISKFELLKDVTKRICKSRIMMKGNI